MHSIASLISLLRTDFPDLHFLPSDDFRWSPQEKTIYYQVASSEAETLLHELSHAILKHEMYRKDLELIELERDAWEYALRILGPKYKIKINDETVQDSLDTYRDWLHARSVCPNCQAVGLQTKKNEYKCLGCTTSWRVNDARSCALRRYKT